LNLTWHNESINTLNSLSKKIRKEKIRPIIDKPDKKKKNRRKPKKEIKYCKNKHRTP